MSLVAHRRRGRGRADHCPDVPWALARDPRSQLVVGLLGYVAADHQPEASELAGVAPAAIASNRDALSAAQPGADSDEQVSLPRLGSSGW